MEIYIRIIRSGYRVYPGQEKWCPHIKYIPGEENIAVDALSWLPNNVNKKTKSESTYLMETISKH